MILDAEGVRPEMLQKPGAAIEEFFVSVGVNGFAVDFWRSQLDYSRCVERHSRNNTKKASSHYLRLDAFLIHY
ncbi:hypothetical protein CF394_02810 [Tetzosporium hominis]|uniref:Uncharacterized protein n=1 Tax=Tetzosporium hominis TaxID=2020506 RepID=A0A264W6Z5_9BACL|nr:hypothetical protein CF394_02810 [Tetzosporium hominis]